MKDRLEKIQDVASQIDNFRDYYGECVLRGSQEHDGQVPTEKLIEWLIENPHMQKTAKNAKC